MRKRCLFNYSFVFGARAKKFILDLEQQNEMMTQALQMGTTNEPRYLTLKISRSNIVEDTIKAIENINNVRLLKGQLAIQFDGEIGVDYGGLKKELIRNQ